jgi:uncharacterized membrane protein YfcA
VLAVEAQSLLLHHFGRNSGFLLFNPCLQGTSLTAMILPSLIGLAQHQKLGNVDWRMAAALAVGTSVGSYVGSNFAVTAPAGVLEGLFAAGMLLLGRRTLVAAAKTVPKSAQ